MIVLALVIALSGCASVPSAQNPAWFYRNGGTEEAFQAEVREVERLCLVKEAQSRWRGNRLNLNVAWGMADLGWVRTTGEKASGPWARYPTR